MTFAVQRIADVQLRGTAGPLPARVYWPDSSTPVVPPALVVFFPADRAEASCRWLCSEFGLVVLSAFPAASVDAPTAAEWAADHATELGADPERLLVAGEGAGADLAAYVVQHAENNGWPTIEELRYP